MLIIVGLEAEVAGGNAGGFWTWLLAIAEGGRKGAIEDLAAGRGVGVIGGVYDAGY